MLGMGDSGESSSLLQMLSVLPFLCGHTHASFLSLSLLLTYGLNHVPPPDAYFEVLSPSGSERGCVWGQHL